MKVYLKGKMGGEVVAGGARHILPVQVEVLKTTEGDRLLYYVNATEKEKESLIGSGLAVDAEALAVDTLPPRMSEDIDDLDLPEEEMDGSEPERFFCPDHGEEHQRGTALYYACLDNYLSAEPKKPSEPSRPQEPEEIEPVTGLMTLPHVTSKVCRYLEDSGIGTVEQLRGKTIDELVKIKGIGRVTARWILSEAKESD